MAYMTSYMTQTQGAIDMIVANFSGVKDIEDKVANIVHRLQLSNMAQAHAADVRAGNMDVHDFDMWFANVVKATLEQALGKARNVAVKAAQAAGAKDASTAVSRRLYKDRPMGNINILGNRKRVSFKTRPYPEGTGGQSGIRRHRTVSPRTKKLYEYFGPDRAFVLRFLESGTDIRTAQPAGPTGRKSQSTYGKRGMVGARSFFGKASSEMEAISREMGVTLINYVEDWVQNIFDNEKK